MNLWQTCRTDDASTPEATNIPGKPAPTLPGHRNNKKPAVQAKPAVTKPTAEESEANLAQQLQALDLNK